MICVWDEWRLYFVFHKCLSFGACHFIYFELYTVNLSVSCPLVPIIARAFHFSYDSSKGKGWIGPRIYGHRKQFYATWIISHCLSAGLSQESPQSSPFLFAPRMAIPTDSMGELTSLPRKSHNWPPHNIPGKRPQTMLQLTPHVARIVLVRIQCPLLKHAIPVFGIQQSPVLSRL